MFAILTIFFGIVTYCLSSTAQPYSVEATWTWYAAWATIICAGIAFLQALAYALIFPDRSGDVERPAPQPSEPHWTEIYGVETFDAAFPEWYRLRQDNGVDVVVYRYFVRSRGIHIAKGHDGKVYRVP